VLRRRPCALGPCQLRVEAFISLPSTWATGALGILGCHSLCKRTRFVSQARSLRQSGIAVMPALKTRERPAGLATTMTTINTSTKCAMRQNVLVDCCGSTTATSAQFHKMHGRICENCS
jgi:hypothetical protein